MNKEHKKEIEKLISKLSLKYNLPKDHIRQIVESPYEFAKLEISKLDLNAPESKEEFNELKTNFIFRYLGKLHTSYGKVGRIKKGRNNFKLINEKKWKNK